MAAAATAAEVAVLLPAHANSCFGFSRQRRWWVLESRPPNPTIQPNRRFVSPSPCTVSPGCPGVVFVLSPRTLAGLERSEKGDERFESFIPVTSIERA